MGFGEVPGVSVQSNSIVGVSPEARTVLAIAARKTRVRGIMLDKMLGIREGGAGEL